MKIFNQLFLFITLLMIVNSQFDLQDYGIIIPYSQKSKYYWGTYKPNLYFAMKNRRNVSDVFGMMWYASSYEDLKNQGPLTRRIRHNCKMEDELNYRWEEHNGLDYGNQIIEDNLNKLKLNTKFVKNEFNTTENQHWEAYIQGKSESWNNRTISLILYTSMENFEISDKSFFDIEDQFINFFDPNLEKNQNVMKFKGSEKGKDKYTYSISFGKDTNLIGRSFQRYRKRYNETWRVKKFLIEDLLNEEERMKKIDDKFSYINFQPNKNIKQPNIVAIQLVFQGDFEILVNFSTSATVNSIENFVKNSEIKKLEFNKKFDEIYWSKLSSNNFNKLPDYIPNEELKIMSQQALSNILGGVGYFWGAIKINLDDKSNDGKYHIGFRYAVENKGLFTATPSRSFFARGFLWDEGFHNLIISQWDINISVDIIDSWLSTMSATGWMAREQIRGPEAEAQVPERFVIQDKLIANPPTFIFPIENILNYYKFYNEEKNLKNVNSFLKKCFDKFGAWYEWFEIYQKSSDRKSYQWYGRNSEHNLACGLDDYPRAMTPNIYERHLDLALWISELIKTLRSLSELFDFELVSHFDKTVKKMETEFKKLFLDEEKEILNDFLGPQFKLLNVSKFKRSVPPYLWRGDGKCGPEAPNSLGQPSECNPYSDAPCCSEFGWCGNTANHCNCSKCKRSEKLENRKEFKEKEKIFNPHIGYVNLYPIAFGLLKPEEKVFRSTLKFLSSPDELFSNYGIRSLSKSDSLYHTGDDYWRGNIWINLNFLVLRGLYKFYKSDAEAFGIYKILRDNLIKNIYNQWKINKTFYEQYSDKNGEGLKARPFNGWTSLILNIITEKYDN